tara:strand:- start:14715 stop:15725 length:1011 start_codon:yes stop_codon:yes gene_type:complete
MSQTISLLTLPREIRDEVLRHLALPSFVYTSSDKPNTSNLHRTATSAKTYVDTRISLPSRIAPNLLGVCRQLRAECLQHHTHTLAFLASPAPIPDDPAKKPTSNVLAERLGTETDEEAERLHDAGIRITLEAARPQRGRFGYAIPAREDLSPRFLALLPLMQRARKVRLVVWPGFDWWNGARPRAPKLENGRARIDDSAPAQPDAVSFAIGKVLACLPDVEELCIDVLVHVGELSRWDLPDAKWAKVQYWLDAGVGREGGGRVGRVGRRLAGVWNSRLVEAFYEQEERRVGESGVWRVKRKGDMRTVSDVSTAWVWVCVLTMKADGGGDGRSEGVG